MDRHPNPQPQPHPSRPPLPTSETNSTLSSTAPTLCEKPDDISSFLRGGASHSSSSSSSGTHKRRRWTYFALVALVALFLGSCGGAALSGLLFWGIGVVDGIKVQWIAQSLVMFASITSLLYTILHIRAARLGRLLFAGQNIPTTSFKHTLQARATLVIRAATVFWTASMPAVAMGVYYGGKTILKLDLLVCTFGWVSAVFFAVILHMVEQDPFEVAVLSPVYLRGGRAMDGSLSELETGGKMRGGGGGEGRRGGNKSTSSSISSASSSPPSSSSWSGGSSGGIPNPPAHVYGGSVGGPRPPPGARGAGPNLARGKSGRVLTRLSAIHVGNIPPAPVPVPAPVVAEQGKPRAIVAGVASTLSSYFWPPRGAAVETGQGGGGTAGGGDVSPGSEGGGRPVSGGGRDNMPGTFHGGEQRRGW